MQQPATPVPQSDAEQPRVLLVDPYRDGWATYLTLLGEQGMRASAIATGEEALRCARQQHPTVVVVDLALGVRRGGGLKALEVISALRRLDPAPQVLAVSAVTGGSVLHLSAGPVPVLAKEDAAGLIAAIADAHAVHEAFRLAAGPRP